MVSAFYDRDGGHQGELGVPLEVGDVGHAYVAHGGADLVEGGFHVVVEGAGVGDVGVPRPLQSSAWWRRPPCHGSALRFYFLPAAGEPTTWHPFRPTPSPSRRETLGQVLIM